MSIQFKVFSELYGTTDCCIHDIERAIKIGSAPCGDGNDYSFSRHELEQLKTNPNSFIPSSELKYPLNLFALLRPHGNKLLLPNNFRFDKTQYSDVKKVCLDAGGKYIKNSFEFTKSASEVYDLVLNGGRYNLKKEFQFFGTPTETANWMAQQLFLEKGESVLEPSAGQGALIDAVLKEYKNNDIFYCELMIDNQLVLSKKYSYHPKIYNLEQSPDFLKYDGLTQFDKIIANPPFSKNQDIDHILKMYEVLKPGGRIVTISSKHWQFADGKKEKAFKKWVEDQDCSTYDLDAGTFKASGTNAAGVIIIIDKPR